MYCKVPIIYPSCRPIHDTPQDYCTRPVFFWGARTSILTLHVGIIWWHLRNDTITTVGMSYSISQEICTRFLLPISIRLTSLALWQSNDCPSASKATLVNMDKYFMGIHYERLHNHNKAKHNKTMCIFLGIHCTANITGRICRCYWLC